MQMSQGAQAALRLLVSDGERPGVAARRGDLERIDLAGPVEQGERASSLSQARVDLGPVQVGSGRHHGLPRAQVVQGEPKRGLQVFRGDIDHRLQGASSCRVVADPRMLPRAKPQTPR